MSAANKQNTPQPKGPHIHAQLAAIMRAAEAVGKDRSNDQQKFKFRGIEDVMNMLHPIFAEHQVFILSDVVEEKTEERATRTGGSLIYRILKVQVSFVSGTDGSRETVTVIGEGMDSGDKASNKAMSAAMKYALTQTLILPYGQVDADATTPEQSQGTGKPPPAAAARPPARKAPPWPAPAGAPAATAAGNMKSAYDGRTLKPGEDPLPKQTTPAPEADPTFNTRLFDSMASHGGITEDELTDYLRSRGIITATQTIDQMSEALVNTMLDRNDKQTGQNNFELIANNIQKARKA